MRQMILSLLGVSNDNFYSVRYNDDSKIRMYDKVIELKLDISSFLNGINEFDYSTFSGRTS